MSEISKTTQSTKSQTLDSRYITEVVYLGDDNSIVSDHITQIPQTALQEKDQTGLAEVQSMKLADSNNDSIPKWTEEYNAEAEQATAWIKLPGVSSPDVPRPIVICAGDNDSFDASGTFIPGSPDQENDSGAASKIVISGMDITPIIVLSNLQAEAPTIPHAAQALFPSMSKQLYIDKDGTIVIFVGVRKNGDTTHRPHFMYSKDAGETWTIIDPDDTYSGMCFSTSITVDKHGNYHLIWSQTDETSGSYDRHVTYRKYSSSFVALSSVIQISDTSRNYTYDASLQLKNDGETVGIIWTTGGYSAAAYNLYYREIASDGTLSAILQITSDAVRYTKDYRSPTIDFDSNDYAHIYFATDNTDVSPSYRNFWYIEENSGGLQPMVQINSENNDDGYDNSNILVDYDNTIWVAYTTDKVEANKQILYIKNIKSGVIGSRTLVEAGGAGNLGGYYSQIQQMENKNILITYNTRTSPYQISSREITPNLVIGDRTALNTQDAGYDNQFPHIPYGIYPNVDGVRTNVPQQGSLLLYIKTDTVDFMPADLILTATPNAIIGSTTRPIRTNTRTINIRGNINKTKFNNMANPTIS